MKKWTFFAFGVGALAAAGSAGASAIYTYSSGSVDVTSITVDGTSVFSAGTALPFTSGSTATLDSATSPTQLSFLFGDTGGSIALSGTVSFVGSGGKTNLLNFGAAIFSLSSSVNAFSLQTVAPLTLTAASGGYNFNSGVTQDLQISGTWSLSGLTDTVSGTTTPITVAPTGFGPNTQTISGTLGLAGGGTQLSINGVTLGTFTVQGQSIVVTGDIIFNGATPVPLPESVWLLGSALGLLGFWRVGRRSAI